MVRRKELSRVRKLIANLESNIERYTNRLENIELPEKYWELQEKIDQLLEALSGVTEIIDDIKEFLEEEQ